MTEEEKQDAIQIIAYLMLEYYDKKEIIEMYPNYKDIYDSLQVDAMQVAARIVQGSNKY